MLCMPLPSAWKVFEMVMPIAAIGKCSEIILNALAPASVKEPSLSNMAISCLGMSWKTVKPTNMMTSAVISVFIKVEVKRLRLPAP